MTGLEHPHRAIRLRREEQGDVEETSALLAAAFAQAPHSAPPVRASGPPGEVALLDWLRHDVAWLPDLALVAVSDGRIVGQVVCTRADVEGEPALGLGPLSVHPRLQGHGVGTALVREVLARAEESGETVVALVGEPAYYQRFGFVPAREVGIVSPEPSYGDYFQARRLRDRDHPRGRFRYAAPFDRL